jgi:alkylhydroperoxidase/carboxymuconolactone decarboxylase family protein YurZ
VNSEAPESSGAELSREQRIQVRLGAAVVLSNGEELRRLRAASQPNRAWREVLLQATLFAGFPRVIDAFDVLLDCGGLGAAEEEEACTGEDNRLAGRELFGSIYGQGSDRVREHLQVLHPQLAHWIEGHAYGRVLAREGLSASDRELVAVAMLTVSGLERQLASHARGAVRLGASAGQTLAVVEAVADLADPDLIERARAVVRSFAR